MTNFSRVFLILALTVYNAKSVPSENRRRRQMNGGGGGGANYVGGPPPNPLGGGSGPSGMHGGGGGGPPQGSPAGGLNYNMQGPGPAGQPFNDMGGQHGLPMQQPQQQLQMGGGRPPWGGQGYGGSRMGPPPQQQDPYGGGYVGQQGNAGFSSYGGGYGPQGYYGQPPSPYAFAGTSLSPNFGPYNGRHNYGGYQQPGGYNDYYGSRGGYYAPPAPPSNPWGAPPPRPPPGYGQQYGGYESYGPPPPPGPFGQYGGQYSGIMGPQSGQMGIGMMQPQNGGPPSGYFSGPQMGGASGGLANGMGPSGPMGSGNPIGEGGAMNGAGGFGPNSSGRMGQSGPSGNFMGPMNFGSGPPQGGNQVSGGPSGNFPQKEKRSLNQPNSYYQYSIVSTYENNHFVDRPQSSNFPDIRNLTKNSSIKKPSIGGPLCGECVPVDIEKFAGSWVQIFGNPASVRRILSKAIKHIISPVMSNPFFEYDAERENEDGQVSPSCLGYEFGLTNFSKNELPLIILFRKESNIRRLLQVHATMIKSGNEFVLQMQNFSQSMCVVKYDYRSDANYAKAAYITLLETSGPYKCRAHHVLARNSEQFFAQHAAQLSVYFRKQLSAGSMKETLKILPFPEQCEYTVT